MADKAAWGATQCTVGGDTFWGERGHKSCRVPVPEDAMCKVGCQAKGKEAEQQGASPRTWEER